MRIDGAVALVTGGARGLGLAIASHLQSLGATVIAADLDQDALSQLPASLTGRILDVTSPADARAVIAEIIERHGRIDILVNNAGVIYNEPFVNIMNPDGIMHDYGRFRASLNVNLDSVFIMTSAVVEQMVTRRGKGVIVNISSICACGNEGQTAYSAAKAAVNAMTVTWSRELGRWGIRCNAVAPGFIDTDSTRRALSEPILKHIQASTPLRRLGEAGEVAQAVAAVIENDFINGAVLAVNGGLAI
ncbi:SDR family NAD(P)-dependent oxidoreductase [Sulfuritalea hydrogenivorans]|uniref:3-ketoacyl-(Acyl-carrier-protein) reductase n=1 Tax=Sulfuritalea hydrogenivorans sk43H TaxID=1223802 RepID=W0SGI4_9PROT|nr:SDR family oxidoreductase [Sulfuritalea hydrogenivorans]MDK9714976.1 SDR family oxidoreductase [Sulfuritalea sp.]BAO28803.1 3-ketoacyl-(acyl-carrier-protein) reductase [Sulfuritalea hydrogenivorans sk43H]